MTGRPVEQGSDARFDASAQRGLVTRRIMLELVRTWLRRFSMPLPMTVEGSRRGRSHSISSAHSSLGGPGNQRVVRLLPALGGLANDAVAHWRWSPRVDHALQGALVIRSAP